MNVSDFIVLLQNSNTILSPSETRELEVILEEYPYFQAARALHLKGLKNLESYKYNSALKLTAAHTADREILFDYITSRQFDQNHIADSIIGRETELSNKEIISEEVLPNPDAEVILGESEENPLPQNIEHAEKILDPALFKSDAPKEEPKEPETPQEQLGLGKPIAFTQTERHSFSEWLQLSQKRPLRQAPKPKKEFLEKEKKFELLNKFLENNPKIVPTDDLKTDVNIKKSLKIDENELMTATLAKVYLEQKKYKKAIQAYKILSLKYPEKSGFFANQIKAVEQLQEQNNKA